MKTSLPVIPPLPLPAHGSFDQVYDENRYQIPAET